jgi:hypothetical protein
MILLLVPFDKDASPSSAGGYCSIKSLTNVRTKPVRRCRFAPAARPGRNGAPYATAGKRPVGRGAIWPFALDLLSTPQKYSLVRRGGGCYHTMHKDLVETDFSHQHQWTILPLTLTQNRSIQTLVSPNSQPWRFIGRVVWTRGPLSLSFPVPWIQCGDRNTVLTLLLLSSKHPADCNNQWSPSRDERSSPPPSRRSQRHRHHQRLELTCVPARRRPTSFPLTLAALAKHRR